MFKYFFKYIFRVDRLLGIYNYLKLLDKKILDITPLYCYISLQAINILGATVHIKKHLSFNTLRKSVGDIFHQIDDHRQSAKVDFALHDCLMSALAMMFFQDPSLLSFQRRMQDSMQCNNLKTMFGVENIPSDTVLRKTVDPVDTANINSCFNVLFQNLQRGKQLEYYKLYSGHYLIALDGTQYFSSENISCPFCLTYKGSRKKMRYSHQVLQAAMLNSNMRQVIPLAPEPIIKSDGDTKNDCERSAGKRLIDKIRADHPKLKIMVTCDGLYSNQPFIDKLKDKGMSYILVAKSTDHSILFEWIEELEGLDGVEHIEFRDEKGRRHHYRWVNQVPLNDTRNADQVNFFEYWLKVDQKVTCHNSWVTDQKVTRQNVSKLVKAGRTRWKIKTRLLTLSRIKVIILNITSAMAAKIYRTIFLYSTCWHFSFIKFLNCVTEAISIAVQNSVPVKNIGIICVGPFD